jgi:hypothetical protein
MSERKSFFSYTASGSAVGGILTSPNPLTVPTQAMISLSPSGGHSKSTVEHFGIDGVLTVGRSTTTAQGDPKQTELTVTLEDVNIMNRVTVARIVLHLVAEGQREPGAYEASLTPLGSTIEGLRVDQRDVNAPNRADVFDRYRTFSGLEKAYEGGELKGLILAPDALGEVCSADKLVGCETRAGNIRATLFPLGESCGDLPVVNGGLRVKDFATLYLGSYQITKFTRRLTMLRVELGCDLEGSFSMADGAGNGQWDPAG